MAIVTQLKQNEKLVVIKNMFVRIDKGLVIKEIRDTARNAVIVKLYDRLVGRFALNDVVNPETGEVIVKGNTMITEETAQNSKTAPKGRGCSEE